MDERIGRREFLEAAAAAGAAALLSTRSDPADATDTNPFDRAMRWGQLAFVENDPGRYDPGSGWTTSRARTATP